MKSASQTDSLFVLIEELCLSFFDFCQNELGETRLDVELSWE